MYQIQNVAIDDHSSNPNSNYERCNEILWRFFNNEHSACGKRKKEHICPIKTSSSAIFGELDLQKQFSVWRNDTPDGNLTQLTNSSFKQMSFMRTSTKLVKLNGSKYWRNVWQRRLYSGSRIFVEKTVDLRSQFKTVFDNFLRWDIFERKHIRYKTI